MEFSFQWNLDSVLDQTTKSMEKRRSSLKVKDEIERAKLMFARRSTLIVGIFIQWNLDPLDQTLLFACEKRNAASKRMKSSAPNLFSPANCIFVFHIGYDGSIWLIGVISSSR